jgi:hypothetical protein
MSSKNDEDYTPLPPHLTKYCVITIHFMLLTSIVAFVLDYKLLSLLFFILYLTGFLYWRKPEYTSIFKKIDVFFVFVTFIIVVYYALFKFKYKYKKIAIIGFIVGCIIAIINETLYRFKIVGVFDNDKVKEGFENNEFSYFTLDYTQPDSIEREKCCEFSVLVHCFCLHILPNILGSLCLIGNTYF